MFFKKKIEFERLQVNKIIKDIREQANVLNNMINFIKSYGNLTKRKNAKLKIEDFMRCRNNILSLPLSLSVATHIINSNKKLKAEYDALMYKVNTQLGRDIQEAKSKKELRKTVKKEITKNESSKGAKPVPKT